MGNKKIKWGTKIENPTPLSENAGSWFIKKRPPHPPHRTPHTATQRIITTTACQPGSRRPTTLSCPCIASFRQVVREKTPCQTTTAAVQLLELGRVQSADHDIFQLPFRDDQTSPYCSIQM